MSEHPHAEAAYDLITLDDGTFAVEVVIPETKPTKVSGFDTREKAEAWIEQHKANVATGTLRLLSELGARPNKARRRHALNHSRGASVDDHLCHRRKRSSVVRSVCRGDQCGEARAQPTVNGSRPLMRPAGRAPGVTTPPAGSA